MGLRMLGVVPGVATTALDELRAEIKATADAAAKAEATGQNARQMVINRDATLQAAASNSTSALSQITSLSELAANVQGLSEASTADRKQLNDRTAANEQAIAALQAALDALAKADVPVSYGIANLSGSLAGNGSRSVTITLAKPMPSDQYTPLCGLAGGGGLLGNLRVVGVTAQTKTTVTVQVTNGAMLTVGNLTGASVHCVAVGGV